MSFESQQRRKGHGSDAFFSLRRLRANRYVDPARAAMKEDLPSRSDVKKEPWTAEMRTEQEFRREAEAGRRLPRKNEQAEEGLARRYSPSTDAGKDEPAPNAKGRVNRRKRQPCPLVISIATSSDEP